MVAPSQPLKLTLGIGYSSTPLPVQEDILQKVVRTRAVDQHHGGPTALSGSRRSSDSAMDSRAAITDMQIQKCMNNIVLAAQPPRISLAQPRTVTDPGEVARTVPQNLAGADQLALDPLLRHLSSKADFHTKAGYERHLLYPFAKTPLLTLTACTVCRSSVQCDA